VFTQSRADGDVAAAQLEAQTVADNVATRRWNQNDSLHLLKLIYEEEYRKSKSNFTKQMDWRGLAESFTNRNEEEVKAKTIALCGFKLRYEDNTTGERVLVII
jgi:hypothetical protein